MRVVWSRLDSFLSESLEKTNQVYENEVQKIIVATVTTWVRKVSLVLFLFLFFGLALQPLGNAADVLPSPSASPNSSTGEF